MALLGPNDAVVRLDLERGKTYTITAAGEAFMSSQTGADADPFPGVVVEYGTDEQGFRRQLERERQTSSNWPKSVP